MAGTNIGSAFITIVPTFKGGIRAISEQLNGVDGTKAGGKVGQQLASGAGRAVNRSLSSLSGAISKSAAAAGGGGGRALAAGILGGIVNLDSQVSAKMAPIGKAAGAALAGGIAAGAGMIVKSGIAASDELKTFEKTMSFAGYDGGRIAQAKADMQAYADASVYDLHDIMNTAAQLGANGVENFDQVTQALGNINAASGGTAQSFGLAAQQLVQMTAAGKVSYADWKVFAQDMPGASKAIKDELHRMGAYQGDFNKALEKGQVTSDEFNQALVNIGFTDFAVAAASSSDTVGAAMGQVEASVEKAGQTIFDSLASSGDIEQLTTSVTGWIDGAAQDVVAHMDDIKAGVSTAIGVLRAVAPPAIAAGIAFKSISTAVRVGSTVSAFARGLKSVGQSITTIVGKGAAAGASLAATAAGEKAAGAASAASAPQILASAVAVVALGAGIALACAGMWILAQAAATVAAAGPLAIATLAGMAVSVALLAVGAGYLGPALTAGAVGFVAFGAAVALVGVGMLAAGAGVLMLSSALPAIVVLGGMAAASFLMLGGALAVIGIGLVVAAAGLVVASAGLAVLAVGASVAAVGVALLAVGVGLLGAGVAVLGAGVMVAAVGMLLFGAGITTSASGAAVLAPALVVIAAATAAMSVSSAAASVGVGAMAIAMAGAAAGVGAFGFAMGGAVGPMQSFEGASISARNTLSELPGVSDSVGGAFGNLSGTLSGTGAAFAAMGAMAVAACSLLSSQASAASSAVQSATDQIKSAVGQRFQIDITVGPLPHFYMTGKFDAQSGQTPTVGVNWYARGGVADRPTVVGVGDAGRGNPELISPERMLRSIVREESGGGGVTVNQNVRIVRSDQDLYAASAILGRAAMAAAQRVM